MALDDLLTGYGHHKFDKPKIAGSYKGKSLVVCADAACIWDDLERFGCASYAGRGRVEKEGWDFLTVNKIVETFPGYIEHAYSNEPAILHKFIAARRNEYEREFPQPNPKHTHSCNEGAKWRWPWGGHGTSLLGAVLVGLGLGYDRIVICGGPLDDGPHNGEPHWRACRFKSKEASGSKDDDRDHHWKLAIQKAFEGRVKSMSGRTGEWLGRP